MDDTECGLLLAMTPNSLRRPRYEAIRLATEAERHAGERASDIVGSAARRCE